MSGSGEVGRLARPPRSSSGRRWRRDTRAAERDGAPRLRLLAVLVVIGVVTWLVLPVPALTAVVPAAGPRPAAQPGLPWLSTSDGRMVDEEGRSVLLHGFDDDALLESTMHPAPLDPTDASLMESSGFDVVRLPIAWSLLEPERGHFSTTYLDRIASTVSLLNAHHLYVVLDMHFLGWSPAFGGSGAPAWATLSWVPDIRVGPMPSLTRLLSPAINASTAYFWLTSDWQTPYLDTWRFVAQRFRDDSGVAGYDIINEAHAFPLPPLRFDKDDLFPFYARAITAIGQIDPNHLFLLENDALGDLPTSVVPISAPDLVYAPHVYTGVLFPPAFDGDAQSLDTHVDELAKEASQLPAAMWVGEFGINSDAADASEWIADALAAFADHGSGWAWWQWRAAGTWSVRSPDGTSLNTTLLRELAQPYLAAAPSGYVASGADGVDGRLNVAVATAHGPAQAEIAWSDHTLGAPRVSDGCGAAWTWDPSSSRLSLTVPAGVSCQVELSA
ncbi:MAG: cellulase family glycosylhydrolase [Candidatus Dormibacteria bacterium]